MMAFGIQPCGKDPNIRRTSQFGDSQYLLDLGQRVRGVAVLERLNVFYLGSSRYSLWAHEGPDA